MKDDKLLADQFYAELVKLDDNDAQHSALWYRWKARIALDQQDQRNNKALYLFTDGSVLAVTDGNVLTMNAKDAKKAMKKAFRGVRH